MECRILSYRIPPGHRHTVIALPNVALSSPLSSDHRMFLGLIGWRIGAGQGGGGGCPAVRMREALPFDQLS